MKSELANWLIRFVIITLRCGDWSKPEIRKFLNCEGNHQNSSLTETQRCSACPPPMFPPLCPPLCPPPPCSPYSQSLNQSKHFLNDLYTFFAVRAVDSEAESWQYSHVHKFVWRKPWKLTSNLMNYFTEKPVQINRLERKKIQLCDSVGLVSLLLCGPLFGVWSLSDCTLAAGNRNTWRHWAWCDDSMSRDGRLTNRTLRLYRAKFAVMSELVNVIISMICDPL